MLRNVMKIIILASVSNLPFVIRAGFWVKIACFAIGDQYFTYHFIFKMVSESSTIIGISFEVIVNHTNFARIKLGNILTTNLLMSI